ncbi:alpha/beta hydrolase [soil metagenome]
MKPVLSFGVVLLITFSAMSQQPKGAVKLTEAKVVRADHVYKKTPQGELTLHRFFPTDWKVSDQRPVIVFFFGGGWKSGAYTQFVPQAEYLASRGIVALSADYRIESKHKTTPDKCVEDAKSAIRWVRTNAGKLGIDPKKIIAAGGSAGGHIAACTALVPAYDALDDFKDVSCIPSALVLFNPVLNLPRPVKDASGDDIAAKISPTRFLSKTTPPTWLVYGDSDSMLEQGVEYAKKARDLGVPVELLVAPKQPHGFFNRSPWIESTAHSADAWMVSRGYLTGVSTLKPAADAILKVK